MPQSSRPASSSLSGNLHRLGALRSSSDTFNSNRPRANGARGHTSTPQRRVPCALPLLVCRGGADSVRDTWYGIHSKRVHGVGNMLLESLHWVQAHHPYW